MATRAPNGQTTNAAAIEQRLKNIGEAGLEPFVELLEKYQGSTVDFAKAIEEGLHAAQAKLQDAAEHPASRSRQMAADQFSAGAKWIAKLRNALEKGNKESLIQTIQEQGSQHQEALFAASVIAGAMLGRLGRYTLFNKNSNTFRSTNPQTNMQKEDLLRPGNTDQPPLKGDQHGAEYPQ